MGKKTSSDKESFTIDKTEVGEMPSSIFEPPASESTSAADTATAKAVPSVSKDEQTLLNAGWVKEPKGEMWQCRQPFSTQGPGQVEAIAHGCRRTLEEALKLEAKRPK